MLKRYWFEFSDCDNVVLPTGISKGCGVTAYDYDDAINILKEFVFKRTSIPTIKKFIENVIIEKLDEDHVLPNMGIVNSRGIWFPLGYI